MSIPAPISSTPPQLRPEPLAKDYWLQKQQKELDAARSALRSMIPQRLPNIEGLDMASAYLTSPAVTGDLFDVIQISEDLLAFLICDLSGDGVISTLATAVAKVSFIRHVRIASTPRLVLAQIHADITETMPQISLDTAFVGFLDLHGNKLTYCGIGEVQPLHFRHADASLSALKTSPSPQKDESRLECDEHSVHLSPADWLLLGTSGIYHLFDKKDSTAGRKLFEAQIGTLLLKSTPGNLTGILMQQARRHSSQNPLTHDIALLAVEVLSDSRRNQILEKLGFGANSKAYLQFLTYFEEMDAAIGVLLKDMDNLGFGDDTIRKMKITLTELLVNALSHGNKKDPSKRTTIGHIIDRKSITVSVMDEGSGFNPSLVPDPTLPENLTRDSGRGLYIVRCYVEEMRYNEKGNRVTIVKTNS